MILGTWLDPVGNLAKRRSYLVTKLVNWNAFKQRKSHGSLFALFPNIRCVGNFVTSELLLIKLTWLSWTSVSKKLKVTEILNKLTEWQSKRKSFSSTGKKSCHQFHRVRTNSRVNAHRTVEFALHRTENLMSRIATNIVITIQAWFVVNILTAIRILYIQFYTEIHELCSAWTFCVCRGHELHVHTSKSERTR